MQSLYFTIFHQISDTIAVLKSEIARLEQLQMEMEE